MPRAELLSLQDAETMEQSIDAFGTARLLSFDRDPQTRAPTVEVAHEALLHEWSRVRRWIDESREHLRTHRWLHAAAHEWGAAGRDESFLVSGARLSQLEDWERDAGLEPTPDERGFIAASQAVRDQQVLEAKERREREQALERRSYRRLRALIAVLSVAALLAGGLTVYAIDQGQAAQEQARVARARELAAAAVASLDVDAERSSLLALEAVRTTRAVGGDVLPEAEEALHRAVGASRIVATVPGLGGHLDWSPDGRLFVTEGPEDSGRIDIRDASSGKRVRTWNGHDIDVNAVRFSPDGRQLASTGDDGTLRVWDVATGAKIAELRGNLDVWSPSFSGDGGRVAAAWPKDGLVRVLNVRTGRPVAEFGWFSGEGPAATAFSPDGRRLAVALNDRTAVIILDANSGREITRLEGHENSVDDVDWSPDGHWLLTSGGATARIWDGRTYRPRFVLRGHAASIPQGAWSPDSRRVVTGSADGTARVWSVSSKSIAEIVKLGADDTAGGVSGVAFSPDGGRVMTGDALITSVRIWDVTPAADAEVAEFSSDPTAFSAGVAFGDDLVATTPREGFIAVWDRASQRRLTTVDGGLSSVSSLDFDPRGGLIAAGGQRAFGVFDVASGETAFRTYNNRFADVDWSSDGELLATSAYGYLGTHILNRAGEKVGTVKTSSGHRDLAVRFSPDGELLAVATASVGTTSFTAGRVEIWDWRDSEVMTTLHTATDTLAFDPTGSALVTVGIDGTATVWDVRSGETLRQLRGHAGAVYDAAFSPDGATIATGGSDGTVRLWDANAPTPPVVLRGHTGPVTRVRFSPDGRQLVSSSADATAKVWAVKLDDLITLARRGLTRSLSDEECREFLHTESCPE